MEDVAALYVLAAVEMIDQPAAERSVKYVRDHEHGLVVRLDGATRTASAVAPGSAEAIKAVLSITTTAYSRVSNSHGRGLSLPPSLIRDFR